MVVRCAAGGSATDEHAVSVLPLALQLHELDSVHDGDSDSRSRSDGTQADSALSNPATHPTEPTLTSDLAPDT